MLFLPVYFGCRRLYRGSAITCAVFFATLLERSDLKTIVGNGKKNVSDVVVDHSFKIC